MCVEQSNSAAINALNMKTAILDTLARVVLLCVYAIPVVLGSLFAGAIFAYYF